VTVRPFFTVASYTCSSAKLPRSSIIVHALTARQDEAAAMSFATLVLQTSSSPDDEPFASLHHERFKLHTSTDIVQYTLTILAHLSAFRAQVANELGAIFPSITEATS
jgi:hypothetical protein